jgi:transposase
MERVEILHDLPEDEKICSTDGTPLVEIGRETSEQLEFIPATARVLVHVRPKYACSRCKIGVKIAALPPQPIPKSLASPSLLAFVAVSKYVDALPLYRQEGILARIGVDLSRATLAFWMVRCGKLVQPLINLMRERLLDRDFIGEARVNPNRPTCQQRKTPAAASIDLGTRRLRFAFAGAQRPKPREITGSSRVTSGRGREVSATAD